MFAIFLMQNKVKMGRYKRRAMWLSMKFLIREVAQISRKISWSPRNQRGEKRSCNERIVKQIDQHQQSVACSLRRRGER